MKRSLGTSSLPRCSQAPAWKSLFDVLRRYRDGADILAGILPTLQVPSGSPNGVLAEPGVGVTEGRQVGHGLGSDKVADHGAEVHVLPSGKQPGNLDELLVHTGFGSEPGAGGEGGGLGP